MLYLLTISTKQNYKLRKIRKTLLQLQKRFHALTIFLKTKFLKLQTIINVSIAWKLLNMHFLCAGVGHKTFPQTHESFIHFIANSPNLPRQLISTFYY